MFSGGGGFSQGFDASGFDVLGADISDYAGQTFELNKLGKFKLIDLSKDLVLGDFDVISGGPPCKPWSIVNRARRRESHRDFILVSRFFKQIEKNLPKIFLMENVPLVAKEPTLHYHIEHLANKFGYSIEGRLLRYCDFGAATKRKRYLLFGTRIGKATNFFSDLKKYEQRPLTVKDVIWHLRDVERNAVKDHDWPNLKTIDKYLDKYETNKFGWYILDWGSPAPSFGNVTKTYILHPDAFSGGTKRVISVKEASLIMGFNKDFKFPDNCFLAKRYQMIVDSVSPTFSKIAANLIREYLEGRA